MRLAHVSGVPLLGGAAAHQISDACVTVVLVAGATWERGLVCFVAPIDVGRVCGGVAEGIVEGRIQALAPLAIEI